MAINQLRQVLQSLRGTTLLPEGGDLTDGQLLERYVHCREEGAFVALVQRHGPMVWGVCRRVLDIHQDAEDAFQATFLVLVRKAASVVPRELVANWLHGVAYQTALKARATTARRRVREKQVTTMPEPALEQQAVWDELQPLLDQELRRLPDKYRALIVLCDLEGKTRKEAARHFHLPEGTVASRLATARALLAKRLTRQGPALTGAALAAALSQNVASAKVPCAVVSALIKAATLFAAGKATAAAANSAKAIALAEGVLKTMLLTKLKIAIAVLAVVAVLGVGAATLTQPLLAGKGAEASSKDKQTLTDQSTTQPVKENKEPTAQPTKEKKADEARPQVVSGVVKAVDVEKKTLTVAHQEGESTFSVAPDAHFDIDCKPGDLAKLPAGANVTLSQFVNPSTARHIQAAGASVFARVKSIDVEKNSLTVAGGHSEDRTFRVSKDTVIAIDGQPGKLTGIPVGATLHALNLCVDQQTVRSINVQGESLCHVPVKAVDAGKNTITFADNAPTPVAGKVVPVAPNAEILLDGQRGKLDGLPAGAFVNLVLSVDGKTAHRLDAEGPNLGGCGGAPIKAVDAEKRTITFDDKAPAEVAGKTFSVARDANIVIDGKGGQLTGLPAGSFVNLILSVDQNMARHVHAQGPGVCGVVKEVDVAKHLVTVADRSFSVAPDAIIVIDGKPGKLTLADIPSGGTATLKLRVDHKTVGMIVAKAP